MNYACHAWEFAVDGHLLKLQRLQNKAPRTIAHRPAICMWGSKLRTYRILLEHCGQQAEFIQNHEQLNVRNTGQSEAQHRKYKSLKYGGGKAYDRSSV
jgi:hypothetical protein